MRFIDSVQLGYVQYDTEDPDVQTLVPAWVVWCEYRKEGTGQEPDHALYTDSLFIDSDSFFPVIFNAQTGEKVDPASIALDRCQCPAIIPW